MIGYAFYTTEGVPLYSRGGIKDPGLVSFIDKYGIWTLYAPEVQGGKRVCYVGARFDNVKETILGRLNRVVLLVAIDRPKELQDAWKFFKRESIVKLARGSGLIFDEELKASDAVETQTNFSGESIEEVYSAVLSFLKGLTWISDFSEIPFNRVQVPEFTDIEYPSLSHRAHFLGAVSAALLEFSRDTCVPSVIDGILENACRREGDIVYPLIVYSKGSAPSLGGLWFSRG